MMMLTADRVHGGDTDLIDLLHRNDSETAVCHRKQLCTTIPNWILSHEETGADDFLGALLGGSDSSPASSLWSPGTSDSSVNEDFPTEPTEGLLQPSYMSFPALDTQRFPVPTRVVHHPLQSKPNDISSHVSIDLGWLSEEQCEDCVTTRQSSKVSSSQSVTVKDLLLSNLGHKRFPQNSLRDLVLSEDEKKLLVKEGMTLPSKLPLTKFEEKVLKKIRRKIRNKHSAQESRKKKKEYVDSLEGRMSACSAHNLKLQRKIQELEQTNSALLEQLTQLQTLLPNSKTTQRGTCILVLFLFFSFLMSSNLQPGPSNRLKGEYTETKVLSRSLQSTEEDEDVLPPPLAVFKPLDSLFSTMEKMWAWTNPQPANSPSSNHLDHSHRSGY